MLPCFQLTSDVCVSCSGLLGLRRAATTGYSCGGHQYATATSAKPLQPVHEDVSGESPEQGWTCDSYLCVVPQVYINVSFLQTRSWACRWTNRTFSVWLSSSRWKTCSTPEFISDISKAAGTGRCDFTHVVIQVNYCGWDAGSEGVRVVVWMYTIHVYFTMSLRSEKQMELSDVLLI